MIAVPGLSQASLAKLDSLLAPLRQAHTLFIFGSRARGTWREHSDIDILVKGEGPIPIKLLACVESEIAESDLPVSVDLVDALRASPDFVAAISGELKAI
jgi:predicted nucleotidyltransferase